MVAFRADPGNTLSYKREKNLMSVVYLLSVKDSPRCPYQALPIILFSEVCEVGSSIPISLDVKRAQRSSIKFQRLTTIYLFTPVVTIHIV